jgi:hypothetical protein
MNLVNHVVSTATGAKMVEDVGLLNKEDLI